MKGGPPPEKSKMRTFSGKRELCCCQSSLSRSTSRRQHCRNEWLDLHGFVRNLECGLQALSASSCLLPVRSMHASQDSALAHLFSRLHDRVHTDFVMDH